MNEHETTKKKGGNAFARLAKSPWFAGIAVAIVIIGAGGGTAYFVHASGQVAIDQAQISAPLISLSPSSAGELKQIFVHEGDEVPANAVVAQVGNELIKTQAAGRIVLVNNNIGTLFNPGETVVEMVEVDQLRVEAQVDEDKGLADIKVGQRAVFTVDAFGGKQYDGIVDEVSPAPLATGVAFSISDKRATKQYVVKIRFDTSKYPELEYGMSARAWIFKN